MGGREKGRKMGEVRGRRGRLKEEGGRSKGGGVEEGEVRERKRRSWRREK